MSEPPSDKPDEPNAGTNGAAETHAAAPAQPVVRRKPNVPAVKPEERRDFFSEALREVISPFTSIIERRIQPLLNALEAIPDHADKFASVDPTQALKESLDRTLARALDQPMLRNVPLKQAPKKPKQVDRFLRPPGALGGGGVEFETKCSQCGSCVEACGANAIRIDHNGFTGEGFPYIVPDEQPCVLSEGFPCIDACPTGALGKLTDMLQAKLGIAKVDHATCLRSRGENCTLCIDTCPAEKDGLLALTANPVTGKILVRRNICVGCGQCENICPTEPRSIIVIPNKPPVDPLIA